MAREPKPKIKEEDLHGFKHFKLLVPLLEGLHDNACRRDRRIIDWDTILISLPPFGGAG